MAPITTAIMISKLSFSNIGHHAALPAHATELVNRSALLLNLQDEGESSTEGNRTGKTAIVP